MEMVHFIPPSQRRIAMLAAQADHSPVLIHGGSGTGKGAIAKWIHNNGPRVGRPFIVVNRETSLLAQLPHAQGGTITILEIGSWPLSEQKILLEFLNTKSVPHPENPSMRMIVNARIIATTSQSLDGRAESGLFNAELFEKLTTYRLEMPPLFRRTEELEDIVTGITGEITRELHKEYLREISPDAWTKLKAYDWPGNLRELRNVLRVAVIAAQGDRIEASDLPEFGQNRIDFHATREHFEKIYITELLKTFNWQIDETCRTTRMSKETLLGKMKQYGIEPQL